MGGSNALSGSERWPPPPRISQADLQRAVGDRAAQLLARIAQSAQHQALRIFLVGGLPRDILLGRQSLDLDFALEGDAIAFTREIAAHYGETAQAYPPFGTATWQTGAALAAALEAWPGRLPQRLDFAQTRRESYAQPGDLPTVQPGSIMEDLQRRDFSVNAFALQLSPLADWGKIIAVGGGIDDLKRGLLRSLHARSFVDDPTRILRAVRFSLRLQFAIEAETARQMQAALPGLAALSGQRLAHEIERCLQENEAAAILLRLQALGALQQIHPALHISTRLPLRLAQAAKAQPPWSGALATDSVLRWHMLLAGIAEGDVCSICERLVLPQSLCKSIAACARIMSMPGDWQAAAVAPSVASCWLERMPPSALHAAWLLHDGQPGAQERLQAFMQRWRHVRPILTGTDLCAMGLAPGPLYGEILATLRAARIDGSVQSEADERALLQRLLAEG